MTVIVTGSSRGIGREVARLLLRHRHNVVINGRDGTRLAQTAAELSSSTETPADRILAVPADIATEDGAALLIRETLHRWGRIDALINNAGVSMRGAVGDVRVTAVDHLYRGNLLAAVLPTVAALPSLLESRGSVVFVSTLGALWGFPGISLYGATKAAVESFARSVDSEYRRGGVHSGVCFLGFVENDPDKEVLAADGSTFRHKRRASMTQQQAARAIVRTMMLRRRRTITTGSGRALAAAARVAPGLLGWFLARSGGKVHQVSSAEGSSPPASNPPKD